MARVVLSLACRTTIKLIMMDEKEDDDEQTYLRKVIS